MVLGTEYGCKELSDHMLHTSKIRPVHSNYTLANTVTVGSRNQACLKQPLKYRQNKGLKDQLSLNAGQKYCRMLPFGVLVPGIKPVLIGIHSNIDKTKVLLTNYCLMQAKSIAECSLLEHSAILLTGFKR